MLSRSRSSIEYCDSGGPISFASLRQQKIHATGPSADRLAVALPTAPLGPDGRLIFIRCLALGTIFLIGWTALKVLHIGANLYLRNFHIDAPDNLLARKHVTQVRVLVRVLDTIIVLLTLGSALMLLYLDYS